MANNKFKLHIEGHPYEIERRADLIIVNGVEFPCSVKDKQVTVSGNVHTVKVQANSAEYDGIAYPIKVEGLEEPKTAGTRKAATSGAGDQAGAVTAIMPGLIIKILKKEGDKVQAGETVIILEAMKMQNELHAKVSGVIRQLNVKQGDNVEMRQVLAVVE